MPGGGGGGYTQPSPWWNPHQKGWLSLGGGVVVPWVECAYVLAAMRLSDASVVWQRVPADETTVRWWTTLGLTPAGDVLAYRETHSVVDHTYNQVQLVNGLWANVQQDYWTLENPVYELVRVSGTSGADLATHALTGYGPAIAAQYPGGQSQYTGDGTQTPQQNGVVNLPAGSYTLPPEPNLLLGKAIIGLDKLFIVDASKAPVLFQQGTYWLGSINGQAPNIEPLFRVTGYNLADLSLAWTTSLPMDTSNVTTTDGKIVTGFLAGSSLILVAGKISGLSANYPVSRFALDVSTGNVTASGTISGAILTQGEQILFGSTRYYEILTSAGTGNGHIIARL